MTPKTFLDYTAFNVRYSEGFNSGLSPFLFDRSVDNRVLTAGVDTANLRSISFWAFKQPLT